MICLTDLWILNVRIAADIHGGCTSWHRDRVPTKSWLWDENNHYTPGNRTHISITRLRFYWHTVPTVSIAGHSLHNDIYTWLFLMWQTVKRSYRSKGHWWDDECNESVKKSSYQLNYNAVVCLYCHIHGQNQWECCVCLYCHRHRRMQWECQHVFTHVHKHCRRLHLFLSHWHDAG